MPLTPLLDRLSSRARRADAALERRNAAVCDTNLTQLRRQDPDAARIFTTTFTAADRNPALLDQLTQQIQAYATAKHNAGRLDLYNQLFAGI